MTTEFSIKERVRKYYWDEDLNCATTTLKILGERFSIEMSNQLLDAALGMHGAGGYGAQCGLVEGSLLFIGILGRANDLSDDRTIALCKEFAQTFEKRFPSLRCKVLRPEGFSSLNPPHLCESLTCEANLFSIDFIADRVKLSDNGRNELKRVSRPS